MEAFFGTVVVSGLNLRSVPSSTDNIPIGKVILGDKLFATEKVNGWWKILLINHVPVTKDTYAYEGMTNGFIRQDHSMVLGGSGNKLPEVTIQQTFSAPGYPNLVLGGKWIPNS